MKNYTPDKPAFSDNISITTEGDLVDADNDSAAVKQLLGNTLINAQNIAAEESRACQKESDIENNLDYEIQEIRRLIDLIYANANGYTDNKIAQLVNGAPSTLDTLGEIAKSMQENDTVVNALEKAIGSKANAAEFDSHEIDNIKHITASERAKWNAKQETTGDAKDNTVTFTSDDAKNPAAWTSMVLFKSQEKLSSLFNKVSIMAKNVRYLYKMLGSTDISGIGDGTVTGVLSQLNSNLIENYIKSKIIDIATQVIEKNGTLIDLTALNSEINKDVQAISVTFIDQNNIGQYAWGSAIKYRDWWRCYCYSTGDAYFTVRCVCYY